MEGEGGKMKVATIVGARPQFIKAATVSRAFQRLSSQVEEVIIHTGQHYHRNMSEVFFEEMKIPPPKHNLEISGGSHGAMTGKMLESVERVLMEEQPHWVLVYGDTNSTLAGALAAAKLKIPIAHVEAGMRCFVKGQPEEINRVLTDHCSELLFTSTHTASENLLREGVSPEKIHYVGDVMLDAALHDQATAQPPFHPLPEGYFLATCHRAENSDNPQALRGIVEALCILSQQRPILMPLHPRTRQALEREELLSQLKQHVHLLPPVSYREMIALESRATLVLTDSGGVQKEASFFGKPCVVLREVTEWTELIQGGGHLLAGSCREKILEGVEALLSHPLSVNPRLYGEGDAAQKIAQSLVGCEV